MIEKSPKFDIKIPKIWYKPPKPWYKNPQNLILKFPQLAIKTSKFFYQPPTQFHLKIPTTRNKKNSQNSLLKVAFIVEFSQ